MADVVSVRHGNLFQSLLSEQTGRLLYYGGYAKVRSAPQQFCCMERAVGISDLITPSISTVSRCVEQALVSGSSWIL